MHSIERYGIVALLFLVVTIVAVLLWDGEEADPAAPRVTPTIVEQPAGTPTPRALPEGPGPDDRAVLTADVRPGPLTAATAQRREELVASEPPPAAEPEEERLEVELQPSTLAGSGTPSDRTTPAIRPEPKPVRPAASGRTYVVKSGDTLGEIAQYQLGTSRRWKEIVAVNPGLDPNKLRLGQTLVLPPADPGAPAPTVAREATSAPAEGSAKPASATRSAPTYRVAAGDSLWRIAQRTLGDGNRWREIAALNPKIDPDRLAAGALLVLPGEITKAATTPPKAEPRRAETPPVVASRVEEKKPSRARKVQ